MWEKDPDVEDTKGIGLTHFRKLTFFGNPFLPIAGIPRTGREAHEFARANPCSCADAHSICYPKLNNT